MRTAARVGGRGTEDGGRRAEEVRLHVALARAGVASRRAAEELIAAGRVGVNGEVVRTPGIKVDPQVDRITVDGEPIGAPAPAVYHALHKPLGYVSTASDERGRPTVLDLVPAGERVYPAGRLDADSEGLVLLTNDGELTRALTHPSSHVEKEYEVLVGGAVAAADVRRLRGGIDLDGRRTAPARVDVLQVSRDETWLSITIHEGRKREIRRMLGALGYRVRRLIRVRIGPLQLGRLRPGEFRTLSREEAQGLRRSAGLGKE